MRGCAARPPSSFGAATTHLPPARWEARTRRMSHMNDNTENLNSEEEQHAPNKPSYDEVLEMANTLTWRKT